MNERRCCNKGVSSFRCWVLLSKIIIAARNRLREEDLAILAKKEKYRLPFLIREALLR